MVLTSSIFSVLQPSPQSTIEHFHHSQKKLIPISSHSPFLPNPARGSHKSTLYEITCSGHLHQWNHAGWDFCDCLLWLSTVFARVIHIVPCIRTSFLLWLGSIPVHEYTPFCLSVHQAMASGLFPLWSSEPYVQVFVWTCFRFSWVDTYEWNFWITWSLYG